MNFLSLLIALALLIIECSLIYLIARAAFHHARCNRRDQVAKSENPILHAASNTDRRERNLG